VAEYPRRKQFAEQFKESIENHRRDQQTLAGPLGAFMREMAADLQMLNRLNDPRGMYARLPFELRLN
jgi:protease-4